MRFIIIEDEIPAQRMLSDMICSMRPDWKLSTVLDSVESAVNWFKKNEHPDLVFMDIQLSDGLSFDILSEINTDAMLIFTTAYDKFALRAFRVNSIDYLLKPVKKADLEIALSKFENLSSGYYRKKNELTDYAEILENIVKNKHVYRKGFLINRGDEFFRLQISSAAYFFSRNKVSFCRTFDNKEYVIDSSLEKIYEDLDPEMFFKVNRSMIISLDSFKKVSSWFNGRMKVKTLPEFEEDIFVSREKSSLLKKWLDR